MDTLKYAYYPGCSLESQLAKEFDLSTLAVSKALGIELEELHDWNCCGASSGHSTNMALNHAIVGRNLALAEKQELDIAAACPACYLRLKHTRHAALEDPEVKSNMIDAFDMPYEGRYDVKHVLDIIVNGVGLDVIKAKVVKPLSGLKLVSYYGCVLVRPPNIVGFDDPENPQSMDNLLSVLGADVRDWSGKVDCCGASLSLTKREIVISLSNALVKMARDVGADAMVTACPLCSMNVDSRQKLSSDAMPVFYFTELLGLAMGLPGTNKWWGKHIISPKRLLRSYNLI